MRLVTSIWDRSEYIYSVKTFMVDIQCQSTHKSFAPIDLSRSIVDCCTRKGYSINVGVSFFILSINVIEDNLKDHIQILTVCLQISFSILICSFCNYQIYLILSLVFYRLVTGTL
jgi:hypothetical protein